MNAIEIKNLSKKYKGFALDDISFSLPSGCILGLIGENGAGKGTTIKAILDMIKPDSGEINVLGQKMSADLKNDIGVVLDEVGLPETINIKNILFLQYNLDLWNIQQLQSAVKLTIKKGLQNEDH